MSKVSNVLAPTNGPFFGFAENSGKSIVSKRNEMVGKWVENNLNNSESSKKRTSGSSSDSSTNSEKNKMAGNTRVLKKRVEHKRSFPGYLGNRTLDAKLAKIKRNLNEKKFGKVNTSTKNNLKSSGSSIRRSISSDSDQGSNVPIPIHFKCGIIEYTKIAYR